MSMIPTLQDALNLIPPPNNCQPNFMSWYQANIQILIDTIDVLSDFSDAFYIGSAVGPQLDVIGTILGVSRLITFDPPGGLSPFLTDDYYRLVLYAKILKNQWHGTIPEIYAFWKKFLPQYPILIQDNQNMTMNMLIFGMNDDISGEKLFSWDTQDTNHDGWNIGYWGGVLNGMLRNLVANGYFMPKPAGVMIQYAFSDQPIFAWDQETTYLQGWNQGNWIHLVP